MSKSKQRYHRVFHLISPMPYSVSAMFFILSTLVVLMTTQVFATWRSSLDSQNHNSLRKVTRGFPTWKAATPRPFSLIVSRVLPDHGSSAFFCSGMYAFRSEDSLWHSARNRLLNTLFPNLYSSPAPCFHCFVLKKNVSIGHVWIYTIHNSQVMEIAKMPHHWRMD
jgi:hypothetical protein